MTQHLHNIRTNSAQQWHNKCSTITHTLHKKFKTLHGNDTTMAQQLHTHTHATEMQLKWHNNCTTMIQKKRHTNNTQIHTIMAQQFQNNCTTLIQNVTQFTQQMTQACHTNDIEIN